MRTKRTRALTLLPVALLLAGIAHSAHAGGPLPEMASRLDSPGRSSASEDSAESLVLNPANLAFLPGGEVRWTGEICPEAQKVNCGMSLGAATPLPFGLSTGARLDYLIPPDSAGFPYSGYSYAWGTWGVAYKLSQQLAIGASLQHSYSSNAYTSGLWGVTTAVSYRPYSRLALSFIAQDWNGPSEQVIGAPGSGVPVLDRSYVLAAAFRPTGRRNVEIGLELKCQDLGPGNQCIAADGLVEPRFTAGVDIPGVGRARADVTVAHFANDEQRSVVGTAGLEIALGRASIGGGAVFGNGLGSQSNAGAYATTSFSWYMQPGVFHPREAVSLRIEKTPDVRGHTALLRKLWRIADDVDIAAVTLVLRAEPADSYAHAEELADAIRVLHARKKKVLCSWEDAGPRALYVCANANRIVVNPAGGLRYAGLRMQYMYLGNLLKKLGIRAEFVRVSDHKSAPEQFTNEHASPISAQDHEDLLREFEAVFNKDVAVGRKLSEARVQEETAKGPFVASEAKEAGFVDGTAFDDELERATRELVGSDISYNKYEELPLAPASFGDPDHVALVYVEGDMVDGRSSHIPILNMSLAGSYSVADTLDAVKNDPHVKAVVLRIESPGGSSMAADVMWRAASQLAKKKPLVVSLGTVAASGGYYIASAANEIYALPLTVTGSIGVFYGKADLSGLMQKIGVSFDTYKTTPRADAESLFRPFTEDEERALAVKIHQYYETFLDRVSTGRHMTKEEVDAVGEGRVWTGQEALDRKLVDKLGGLREALADARRRGGLADDAPIEELPKIEHSLLETALGLAGVQGSAGEQVLAILPAQVKQVAVAIAPMAIFADDVPLARLEWVNAGDTP
jgi:protease-4